MAMKRKSGDTQRWRAAAAVIGLGLMRLGAGPAHAQLALSPWPMADHDLRHTGQSPYVGPQAANVKWIRPIQPWTFGSFLVGTDGTLYVTVGRQLCALDPDAALVHWCHNLNASIKQNIAGLAADGTLYIGDRDNRVTGINPDGSTRCVFQVGRDGDVNTSPAIGPDGTVYMGGSGNVHALTPDCVLKWKYKVGTAIAYSNPAVAPDGTIYIGSGGGFLNAINPDGSPRWATNVGGGIKHASPAIAADGTIYIGSKTGFTAVNPDGTVRWGFTPTGGTIQSTPAIANDGTVYVGSRGVATGGGAALFALDPDGNVLWSYATGESFNGSPAIGADGVIYAVTGQRVIAVRPDGTLLWDYATLHRIFSSPAIAADGSLYVGSESLYAFAP
jgi:outer membrane protein assembly factor BamB